MTVMQVMFVIFSIKYNSSIQLQFKRISQPQGRNNLQDFAQIQVNLTAHKIEKKAVRQHNAHSYFEQLRAQKLTGMLNKQPEAI